MKYLSLLVAILFLPVWVMSQKFIENEATNAYGNYSFNEVINLNKTLVDEGNRNRIVLEELANAYFFNADYKLAGYFYSMLFSDYDSLAVNDVYRYYQTMRTTNQYDKADSLIDHYVHILSGLESRQIQSLTEGQDQRRLSFSINKINDNSPTSDFAPSFLGENKILMASARKPGEFKKRIHKWNNQAFLDIYVGDMNPATGDISNLGKLSPLVNSKYHETTTAYDPQTRYLYFTRNSFDKSNKNTKNIIRLKIYRVTEKQDGRWGNLIELPFNNNAYSVANPALSPDHKRLFFSSDMPGTVGNSDLFYVDIRNDSVYGDPVSLGLKINTIGRETYPFIDKNGYLYFSSDGRNGNGGLDVYMAAPESDGSYGIPMNLGEPINSTADDFSFIIDQDRSSGYFASNRDNPVFDDDIYSFTVTQSPECKIKLYGLVTDAKTQQLLSDVTIGLYDVAAEKMIKQVKTNETGEYNLTFGCKEIIKITSGKTNYQSGDSIIFIQPNSADLNINLNLTSLETRSEAKEVPEIKIIPDSLDFQPVYFGSNQSNVTDAATKELEKIIEALREYPKLKIQIISYADSRGDKDYNYQLSKKRSEAIASYIIEHGNISSERLISLGRGEVQLENSDIISEKIHQKNRRTEFEIITE
ncbi:MAG TPA: OmpA family protein [Prolixibacteraceae bacterium]|nr:OmpA family protein [Prolixibacteraceae bacterium]